MLNSISTFQDPHISLDTFVFNLKTILVSITVWQFFLKIQVTINKSV